MKKRLPEKESFVFYRTAASGQVIVVRLTISHRTSYPIAIERCGGCDYIISGETGDAEAMATMLGEISEFAKERLAQAEALTIDEA